MLLDNSTPFDGEDGRGGIARPTKSHDFQIRFYRRGYEYGIDLAGLTVNADRVTVDMVASTLEIIIRDTLDGNVMDWASVLDYTENCDIEMIEIVVDPESDAEGRCRKFLIDRITEHTFSHDYWIDDITRHRLVISFNKMWVGPSRYAPDTFYSKGYSASA